MPSYVFSIPPSERDPHHTIHPNDPKLAVISSPGNPEATILYLDCADDDASIDVYEKTVPVPETHQGYNQEFTDFLGEVLSRDPDMTVGAGQHYDSTIRGEMGKDIGMRIIHSRMGILS